ncbi:hypothetical protein ACG33_12915 [Steroidobacter denitrificans]|uniref:histidine kinase n=1 Tax=Steroidobacter denitrificans TaxID=465721 RepID=A0A127FC29_STEDE|nr:PAS domain-containing sensor histidine kinase [Steroidobacter denitrificans]AMN47982.1 hypothetical protein ACG33_12915 [Steroidobacter denitrificans]
MTAAASLSPIPPALDAVLDTLGKLLGYGVLIVDAGDPRRPILYANHCFIELTGHEIKGASDRRVARFITLPADPKLNREFQKALKTGRSFVGDWPIDHKSGTAFLGRIRLCHLQNTFPQEAAPEEDLSPGHILVTLENLSRDRRDAKDVEQRWERAVRGTSDGLYDWDLHSGHVWYAQRFRAILGYDAQEFPDTFLAFQNVLHEDDRVLVLGKIRAHLESRTRLDIRCRVITRQGEIRWCRLRGEAERDAGGRPIRLSGALSDISEQIDAQEALHRSQDFYGTILDSLPLLILYLCREERVVYVNRPAQEFAGRSLGSLRGRAIVEVLGQRIHAQLKPYLGGALQGQVMESQQRYRNALGYLIDLEASFIPHYGDAGEILGCFIAARDLTERRQLEAELRQSQKMEAVGRLTGGIAHDFNNLLSVIIGNMQLLARSLRESPRLLRQADTALSAAMRGANLTRRLLAFARQQVLEPRVVDLNLLIGGMCELLRRTLTGDVEIASDLRTPLWTIRVDPGQMENAVLNLVLNARDAMPAGGIISITTRNRVIGGVRAAQENIAAPAETVQESMPSELVPGDYVMLEVRDGGMGMSEETLKRVFEPFFTTKDVGKGSGLGLSMVYGFVKQSGGHIQIRSQLGEGTSACLYLPRAHEDAPCVEAQEGQEPDLPRGTETILVVEDNAAVRATAVDILSSLGYRVLEAGNAHEALACFERDTDIALVFSDIMLPGGVLGSQLVDEIMARHADVRVLLTSGFSETSVMSRGILVGVIDLLAKPYTLEELARRVRDSLDGKKKEV